MLLPMNINCLALICFRNVYTTSKELTFSVLKEMCLGVDIYQKRKILFCDPIPTLAPPERRLKICLFGQS
jgi:hypothetical protein